MKTRKERVAESRLRIVKRVVGGLLKRGELSLETTKFVRLKPEPKKSYHKRNPRYCYKLNSKGYPDHSCILSERAYKYFLELKAEQNYSF